MKSKVNFVRSRSSFVPGRIVIENGSCPVSAEPLCGAASYYANQDVFCNLKPKPAPNNGQKYPIYTKEL